MSSMYVARPVETDTAYVIARRGGTSPVSAPEDAPGASL
jgi:hypothetical protein